MRTSRRNMIDVVNDDILRHHCANLQKRLSVPCITLPLLLELTAFPSEGSENLLILHPLGGQILPEVIDKAQKRVHCRLVNRLRPIPQLLNLLGLRSPSFSIEDAAQKLDRWLIELPLLELELKPFLAGLLVSSLPPHALQRSRY